MSSADCTKKVLVVEDDSDVREAIVEALIDAEFGTVEAANGEEALRRLRDCEGTPCLILLDMMMPVMDGWQFRQAQTADPAIADIPVVVLSAHVSASEAANDMRADGFLKKPVKLDALVAAVARFCNDSHHAA